MVARIEQEAEVQGAEVPQVSLGGGRYEGKLEDCLGKYNLKFGKNVAAEGISYLLFQEEHPSLLAVFDTYSEIALAPMAVVSYSLQRNEEIMSDLERQTGIELLDLRDCPQIYEAAKSIGGKLSIIFLQLAGR